MNINGIQGVSAVSGFDISGFTSSAIIVSNLRSGDSLLVTGNRLQNNSANGIDIRSNDFATIEISNNEISGNTRGVYVHSPSGSGSFLGNLNIIPATNGGQNLIHNNSIAGIEISGFSSSASNTNRITIRENFIYNNAASNPSGAGVRIFGVDAPLTISGNDIGLNFSGTVQANQVGISIAGNDVTGVSSIDNNVIAGNIGNGLAISSSAMPNLDIVNNRVGLDFSLISKPNGANGISILNAAFRKIVGNVVATNGTISGGDGIVLSDVQGGTIGTTNSGEGNTIILNHGDGIELRDTTSGVFIEGNEISSNDAAGVHLRFDAGTANSISDNQFGDNGGLPIELEDALGNLGPNPNDLNDADSGPNHLQNYAVLRSAANTGGLNWVVTVDLDVQSTGQYYIEFYRYNDVSQTYTPLRDGGGILANEFLNVNTVQNGMDMAFNLPIGSQFALAVGDKITAVLIQVSTFNTSEFSPAIILRPRGDYNRDGFVDAADYVVYRKTFGTSVTAYTGADGNGDGTITVADYSIWRANFGFPQSGSAASVPGDYNADGIVDEADRDLWLSTFGSTTNLAADGNVNGIVDMADLEVWQEMRGVTTLDTVVGDFNSDFVVDTADHDMWVAGAAAADADGDGVVLGDVDDFNIWEAHFGTVRADVFPMVVHGTEGEPLEIPDAAPVIIAVGIGGYDFSGIVGSGEQLRSVPVANPNSVSIRFSEEVYVTLNALQVINLDGTSPSNVTSFVYDLATQTATWTFNAPFADGRTLLRLSDSVFDLDHDALDGEFTNPWFLGQTESSSLPSGDGEAGGEFRFRFTVLGGDMDHNNIDGAINYQNWHSYEPSMVYVSTTTDDFDGDLSFGDVSLREAIDHANTAAEPTTIELPAGHYYLTRSGTESTSNTTFNDLDIFGNVKVIGAGPGATVIDAGSLVTDDRIFDIANLGVLRLERATLTLGLTPKGIGLRDGGAIRVQNGAQFDLDYSAIVGNSTARNGNGGAIFFAATGHGSITNSVITVNIADYDTGGVYLEAASTPGTGGTVTVTNTIIVNNSSYTYSDVNAGANRAFTSGGHNRLGNVATGFTNGVNGDYIKPAGDTVHYVVTSIVDTYDGTADPMDMSVRDAIYLANSTAGVQEIWLPAWDFDLTRQRTTAANSSELNISEGDLEITDSVIIRGINGTTAPATRVAWITDALADKVFELVGDYNGNGVVDSADYVLWQNQQGQSGSNLAADGNDDGVVNTLDDEIYGAHFGNWLTLDGILVA